MQTEREYFSHVTFLRLFGVYIILHTASDVQQIYLGGFFKRYMSDT